MLLNKKRIIQDLPDPIDPIVLIEKKVQQCPFCKEKTKLLYYNMSIRHTYADIYGIHHNILTYKNRFMWKKCKLQCSCGCQWDTGWYPIDHKMFEITLNSEEKLNDILKEYNLQEENKNNE